MFIKSVTLSPSSVRLIQSMISHPISLRTYFNIILPSKPWYSQWSLSFKFPHQKSVGIFLAHNTYQCVEFHTVTDNGYHNEEIYLILLTAFIQVTKLMALPSPFIIHREWSA